MFNNKVSYLIIGLLTNSLFTLFFLIMTYASVGKNEFGYLTGLFIFENILIIFDLSVNNYVIKVISSKEIKEKKKIVNYFFKKIFIFSFIFYIVNYFFLKEIFWNKIINNQSEFILFITLIVPLIIIIRIFINFLRAVLIGNSNQIKTAKIQIISSLFKFIIFIFFLFYFKKIEGLLLAYLLCFLIEFLLYVLATYEKFTINFFYRNENIEKNYSFNSLKKIFLLSLSIIFFFNIDRVFLSYNLSADILGEYNFIRTLLLGFFILSSAYFYTLLPNISRSIKKKNVIKKKILQNFSSLNLILIFSMIMCGFFFERFIYDFKLTSFLKLENFKIFKIILIATYFNMLGQVFLSFQIASSYLKVPTLINSIIFFISLILINQIFIKYNIEGVATLYLLMNVTSFLTNAFYLNQFNEKIFTKELLYILLRNTAYYFFLAVVMMYFIDYIYFYSKIIFYIFLTIILFFAFFKSQKDLKN